jgi:hypothetical protein
VVAVGGKQVISFDLIVERACEASGDLDVRLSPSDWREVTGVPVGFSVHPEAYVETSIAGHRVHFFADDALKNGQIDIRGHYELCVPSRGKL